MSTWTKTILSDLRMIIKGEIFRCQTVKRKEHYYAHCKLVKTIALQTFSWYTTSNIVFLFVRIELKGPLNDDVILEPINTIFFCMSLLAVNKSENIDYCALLQ